MQKPRRSYPAAAVAAAFLGPGTITTCSWAGAEFGMALLWVLVLSLAVLWIAQEQCVRLGALGRVSLSQALMRETPSAPLRLAAGVLVVGAVGIGCAAYQAGNLRGAAQGLLVLWEPDSAAGSRKNAELIAFLVCAALGTALLLKARRERLIQILLGLVALMTVSFAIAAILARPDLGEVLAGILRPRIPTAEGRSAFLTLAGLVGTTIVPYNLFLHSSLVRERAASTSLGRERRELLVFLPLGIAVSMLVVVTSAAAFHASGAERPAELSAMAGQLQEPLGAVGKWMFAVGIFSAGLSSALTAPIAAGLAVSELARSPSPTAARLVALAVMGVGILSGVARSSPTQIILLAQVANALLLPIALGFLVWTSSRASLLGEQRSGTLGRLLGLAAFLASLAIAGRTLTLLWK